MQLSFGQTFSATPSDISKQPWEMKKPGKVAARKAKGVKNLEKREPWDLTDVNQVQKRLW